MRKSLWLVTYLSLALVAAYAVWPFVDLYNFGRAVHSGDAEETLRRMDLRAVRLSLIDQALTEEIKDGQIKLTMDPHAEALVMEAARAALDARASEFLTPDVIRRLIAQGEFSIPKTAAAAPDENSDGHVVAGFSLPKNPLRYLRSWRLSSPVTFKVELSNPDTSDERIELTLRRQGLTWMLHGLRLSEALLARIKPVIREQMQQA